MVTLKVSTYTRYPGARYRNMGPGSGEGFRDDHLIPWIKLHGSNFIIDFRECYGYPSGFLEEIFGGSIRHGINPEALIDIINNSNFDTYPEIKEEILGYIQDAISTVNLG